MTRSRQEKDGETGLLQLQAANAKKKKRKEYYEQ